MEGHEGHGVHDTHAYPLLPQHGDASFACLSMFVTPVLALMPFQHRVPPTSPSGVYPLLSLQDLQPLLPLQVHTPYFLLGLMLPPISS